MNDFFLNKNNYKYINILFRYLLILYYNLKNFFSKKILINKLTLFLIKPNKQIFNNIKLGNILLVAKFLIIQN